MRRFYQTRNTSTRIAIQYEPEHLTLGDKPSFISATDSDTPTIQTPIRMLGMDAPELHYGGATEKNPGKFDTQFSGFLNAAGKRLDTSLKAHLAKHLDATASTRHIEAGGAASSHFQQMIAKRNRKGL